MTTAMTTTPTPACLPVEHTTQRLTAATTTEALLRDARPQRKQNIAARTPARLTAKIFSTSSCALALARLHHLQLRPCRSRRPCFAHALPITTRLLLATLLAPRAGSIPAATPPATPASRLLTATKAAIPLLGMVGVERLFATLQKAEPRPKPRTRLLRRPGRDRILRKAHGSR
jgi:hypothetical protein